MESEANKLRRDLQRYRYLLRHTADAPVTKVLMELIGEAEARLRALKQQREAG